MAVQMLGIKTKFTDDQGRPLVGGSVHTYYAGTSLPQDTFSDPELTVPNTNPVKLDDTGSANIFLKGTYRVRIFDKDGTFVEEQDNVSQLASIGDLQDFVGVNFKPLNHKVDSLALGLSDVENVSNNLKKALLGNTYYVAIEGFKTTAESSSFDNSPKWDELKAKLKDGDTVVFGSGEYSFKQPLDIRKNILIKGSGRMATQLKFLNGTNGIERHVRYASIESLFIWGSQTSGLVLDPMNKVLGTIGLYDLYNGTSFSGYSYVKDVQINYFDTGRAHITEGSEIWNGAYRDTFSTFIQRNRIGCVFLNGSTEEKFFGGAISANEEVGIWSHGDNEDSGGYNNIKLFGVTIEGNGVLDTNKDGYTKLSGTRANMYSSGYSVIYAIGGYFEQVANLAVNGGRIYKLGSYERHNASDHAINGVVNRDVDSTGVPVKIITPADMGKLFFSWSGGTQVRRHDSDPNAVTLYTAGNPSGALWKSKEFLLPNHININDLLGVFFSIEVNQEVPSSSALNNFVVEVFITAEDGSIGRVRSLPDLFYQSSRDKVTYSTYRNLTTTVDTFFGYLNPNSAIKSIEINISAPAPVSPPFLLNLYSLSIGLHLNKPCSDIIIDTTKGASAYRPLLDKPSDKGTTYYDTTTNTPYVFDGSKWVENYLVDTTQHKPEAQLKNKSDEVNTVNKYKGKLIVNDSDNKMYYALDPQPTAKWRSTDGSNTITPV